MIVRLHTSIALLLIALAGCSGRPQLFPNSDKALQKTSTEFAADASRRFPYKLDVPRGGSASARAQVAYWTDVIEISNLSDEDWHDVEMWVNQSYVVFLPNMEAHKLKHITFQMIFNDKGTSFPTSGAHVDKLEILRDGKMYDVTSQLVD